MTRRRTANARPLKVLVPLDGSSNAERAVDRLDTLATTRELEVLLLRVVHRAQPYRGDDAAAYRSPAARQAFAREYLERVAQRLERRSIPVRVLVRAGEPAHEIVAAAARHRVQMIAMSTRGRSGMARVLLGSVAQAVVRDSTVPVLLVSPARRRATAGRTRG
jgi:nucleotide-binding universal stress UspA family protein